MGRSLNVKKYPNEYFTIIEAVAERGETLKVQCDSLKDGQKTQGHFGAFIAALKMAAETHATLIRSAKKNNFAAFTADPEGDYYMRMHEVAPKVYVWLNPQTFELSYMPREQSWFAQKAQQALNSSTKTPVQSVDDAAAESARRFAERFPELITKADK